MSTLSKIQEYCQAAVISRQIFGIRKEYRETFFANPPRASSSSPYPGELNPWISNVTEYTSPHVTDERQITHTVLNPRFQTGPWPGGWSPQSRRSTGGGGLARVPNLCVCKRCLAWHTKGEKDELTSFRGTVLSAWQKL